MFNSLNSYLKDLENEASVTKDFVRKLQGGIRRLNNSITKAEQSVKEIADEKKYVAKLKNDLKPEAIKLAKNALFDSTVNAIRKRQEFDIPIYRQSIFEAVENSDTYLYRPRGAGFNSVIRIDINLNKTAGRLESWGTAVKLTRKQLKINIPGKKSRKAKREAAARQASRAWAGIYNTRGVNNKYIDTIKKRMSNAAKKGSWWELLDKGATSLTSDRGGYPTPSNKPLNFVDRTEKEVNKLIADSLVQEKEKYLSLINNSKVILQDAKDALNELSSIVPEISLSSRSNKNLSRRAQKALDAGHEEKLSRAITLLRRGLLETKKLSLATKGSYRGRRFSNETFQELLR